LFLGSLTNRFDAGSNGTFLRISSALDDTNKASTEEYITVQNLFGAYGDYVSSFNGRTGAVQGVSAAVAGTGISVSAATGAVTITNTGVQSFNGLTGSVQGVSSVNGQTGAVINVAFTDTGNTFTQTNVFQNDIIVNSHTVGRGGASEATNVAIGTSALAGNEGSVNNSVAIGYGSASTATNTGSRIVSIGSLAMENASGCSDSIAIGNEALRNSGNAEYTIAIGTEALKNSQGINNIAVGNRASFSNTTGARNTAIGPGSLYTNESGTRNIGIGVDALSVLTNHSDNVAIGDEALANITDGSQNIAIGSMAGKLLSDFSNHISATGSIFIGYDTRASADNRQNEIVIGTNAIGLGSNTAVIGATGQVSATIYGLLNAPGGVSAAGITTGALTIRSGGASRYFDFVTGPNNQIIARGNSTLNLVQESHQSIYIGDFDAANNATYIEVDDSNQIIKFYFNGDYYTFPTASGTVGQVLGIDSANTLGWRSSVSSFNGATGTVGISAGSGISITQSGTTFTIASTASGGSKTYAVFTPLDNQPPASNFATLDTRNSIAVLDFDASTDESAVFVGVIPEGASLGSGLKIRISWMATSATSGACRWGVQIERMNTDEDSDSFDTAATGGSTTNGTSGIVTTTEITITTIDSVAAGEPFRLKVFRDADGTSGTDDMTGDAELVSVEVRSAS
jgi:hypothetical protein